MQRVAVVTSHLQPGDAVSNDLIGMCRAFTGRGWDARIYSASADLDEPKTFHISEIQEFLAAPSDLVVYHHSIGWEPGLNLLRQATCRTALKYHNITPPRFFAGTSSWHEEKCRAGLVELKEIVDIGCDVFLADSRFNCEDLIINGAPPDRCFVVPPFHQIDELAFIEADLATLDTYRDGKANILMVGRIAPHKKQDELIRAFAIYHHDYNPQSRLIVVGKEEVAFAAYSKRLRELAGFLAVDEAIVWVDGASLSELKALFLLSRVFAIASEHEGFCVPLVEAMAMKVPVVAFANAAIPETVDSAGVVLDQREPKLMAESIDQLVSNEALNFGLGMMGKRRYEKDFANQKIEELMFRAISDAKVLAAA